MSIGTHNAATSESLSWDLAEEVISDATRMSGLAHAAAVQSAIQREATDAAMDLMRMCRAEHRDAR